MSQQERWVIENEQDLASERRFIELIGSIELTWIEAAVLLHSVYRKLPPADVADLLDKTVTEVDRAIDTLIKKTAVALGYITEQDAGIKLKRVEEPLTVRRRQVKELYMQKLSMCEIARRVGVTDGTVKNDLTAQGIDLSS